MDILSRLLVLVSFTALANTGSTVIEVNNDIDRSESVANVVLSWQDYLRAKADREVEICGYSTGSYCKVRNLADQLLKIIDNESNFGILPDGTTDYGRCNEQYGCGSGKGLIQLIEKTQRHCSQKLGTEILREDPFDSVDCGIYLLEKDPGQISHWEKWSGPY